MQDDRHAAEEVRLARLVERGAHDLELVQVLAADVDEDALRLDAVRGDEAALDQPVRREAHDVAVLERAGLGLVGVHDEVDRLARALREERGLAPGREPGAASPAQVRRRDRVDDRLRLLRSRLRQRLVAADRPVPVELREVVVLGPGGEELRTCHGSPRRSPARPRDARARGSGGRRRRRCPSAAARALDRAQRERAVLRRLARRDAELAREGVHDGLRADERAGEVRADLDHVPPDRGEVEHVVEGRDREAVGGRDVERLGDLAQRLRRQPALVPLLRQAERVEDRRAPVGILLRDLPHGVVERRAHRSASPMTGSSEPAIATRSATRHSCTTVAVAWSAAKLGARNFTRHGLGPPSETR